MADVQGRKLGWLTGAALTAIALAPTHVAAQGVGAADDKTEDVTTIVVSATRSMGDPRDLPIKIEVIQEKEIRQQQTLASTNTELLANLVPSFAPSRQKLTGGGETFRGRTPLYLIDGVPQSTPLRPGGREGVTVDLEVIERVEVLFGANALQGLGGTGGVINYVTVSPDAGGDLLQRAMVSVSSNDGFESDGLGYRVGYLVGKDFGALDFVASVTLEDRGMFYDAEDRPIGIDYESGDVQDSFSQNYFAKVGWEPTADQRLQFMVNRFYLEQRGNYVRVNGDRSAGIPAISVPGEPDPRGDLPINDVVTASVDYSHGNFVGGTFSFQAYYQDFHSLFGGQITNSFQDPLIAPVGTLFEQSENNSEKYGAKFTYGVQDVAGFIDGIIGFDFLRDLTSQPLVLTDRVSVPPTTFYNYAPFAQLSVKPVDWLTVTGGMRYEMGDLEVDDYMTRAGNRADYVSVPVEGGKRSFEKALFNGGLTIQPIDGLTAFGSISEAFSVPDIGRVLRSVSDFGTSVDTLLDLNPIVTKNKEIGAAYRTELFRVSANYFVSTSDFGQRLVANADGTFDLARQATETSGWEFTVDVTPSQLIEFGASYSDLKGKYDGNGDGTLETDLGAADIGPDRMSAYVNLYPTDKLSARLQSFTYFGRDFKNGAGVVSRSFNGYTLVDFSTSYDIGFGDLSVSVSNLLDKQYITYHAQAATGSNALYYAGRGRTFTVRLGTEF